LRCFCLTEMAVSSNFGDLAQAYCSLSRSRIVLVPVPYDLTSTWVRGADRGPAAIIEASANLELYDIETDSQVYKEGIFTDKPVAAPASAEEVADAVEVRVAGHIEKGKFTVVLGGEHSVSIGAFRAHCAHSKDVTILQLDAHCDMRDEYNGSRYNHACVMARAKEMTRLVQVGIRSMDVSEKALVEPERIFFAADILDAARDRSGAGWVEKVISLLSARVYVTIDLDVLDPSIMPSTGTPEPGGLLWYDVLRLLEAVAREREVVGFDVVELCPNESNKAPDFTAAKLIYKFLSYRFSR